MHERVEREHARGKGDEKDQKEGIQGENQTRRLPRKLEKESLVHLGAVREMEVESQFERSYTSLSPERKKGEEDLGLCRKVLGRAFRRVSATVKIRGGGKKKLSLLRFG